MDATHPAITAMLQAPDPLDQIRQAPASAVRACVEYGIAIGDLPAEIAGPSVDMRASALRRAASLLGHYLAKYGQSALFARRVDLRLRLEEVGEKAGLDAATICRCERGNRLPQSVAAIRGYAMALGLEESALRSLVARERSPRLVAGRRGHGSRRQPTRSAVRKAGRP